MPDARAQGRAAALRAGLLAGLVFSLAALALILLVPQGERQAFDQNTFHYRAIARFAAALPWPSFADYESATTPGYHYLLAWIHRAAGGELTTLRLVGSLWGVALVALTAAALARRVGSARAGLALAAPLACSLYILSATTGLLPDGAAWCLVATLLALALRPRISTRTLMAMGAALLALVLIRQIHAWAGILLIAAAWVGPSGADIPSARPSPSRTRHLALACLCGLPALLALAWFAQQWGGLVPPAFSAKGSPLTTHEYTRVSGLSPLTPGFTLALIGGLTPFFLGFHWPTLRRGSWLAPALVAAALGALIAALPLSTWSLEAGRYSGLWNLVRRLPTIADRSPLIIAAAAAGAAALTLWWRVLPPRDRLILAAALVAFTLAHTMQSLVWQRYSEPLLLMLLAHAAASVAPSGASPFAPSGTSPAGGGGRGSARPEGVAPRWAWFGPVLLALANAGVAASAFVADKNPAPALTLPLP